MPSVHATLIIVQALVLCCANSSIVDFFLQIYIPETTDNAASSLLQSFYRLHRLRKLTLSDNEILCLSPNIQNFKNLVELDFSRNSKWLTAFTCL